MGGAAMRVLPLSVSIGAFAYLCIGQATAQSEQRCIDQVLGPHAVNGQVNLDILRANLAKLNACSSALSAEAATTDSVRQRSTKQSSKKSPSAVNAANGQVVVDPVTQRAHSTYFFLRQDFEDLHLISNPSPASEAKGASFSYLNNRVSNNAVLAAKGITGVRWRSVSVGQEGLAADGIAGLNFAPYFKFDVSRNSNAAQRGKDRETYELGAVAESAIRTGAAVHYLRFGGSGVFNNVEDTQTPAAMLQWIPAYRFAPSRSIGLITTFGGPDDPLIVLPYPVAYRFTPSVKARFDRLPVTDGSTVLRDELRYGPQLALFLGFIEGTATPFLERFSSNTQYTWLHSATSNRTYSWLQTSLGFRIDDAGHIALTGTYKNGREELTAKLTDEYLLALSAKW